jgi:phosphoenolpyruvate phosphomutase
VRDLVVVRGYAKDAVNLADATYVDNDAFATTGELASLACAKSSLDGPCLVSYGDVLFKKHVLDEMFDAEGDFVVAVDSLPEAEKTVTRRADWAICSEPHSRKTLLGDVFLKDMTSTPDSAGITGEWTGLLKMSANGAKIVGEVIGNTPSAELAKLSIPDLLRRLVKDGQQVRVVYSRGGWLDVDTVNDLVRGSAFK